MRINYNIPALRTLNELGKVQNKSAKTMERLSSGLKINKSADDAAGLAIGNKMDAQIKALQQSNRNAMDGISMVQIGEGALGEIQSMLQRARELGVQSASSTYSQQDREQIQQEVNQILCEVNRISNSTEFNTKGILSGKPLKETGLTITEMAGGSDVLESRGQIDIDKIPESGTCITVDGNVYEFYDSSGGEYTGANNVIDISKITDTAVLAVKLADVINSGSENVTASRVGDSVQIIAKETGSSGDNIKLADGGTGALMVNLQIGANKNQSTTIKFNPINTETLGLTGKPGTDGFLNTSDIPEGNGSTGTTSAISFLTAEDASKSIVKLDKAIDTISAQRGLFGAASNRLEYTIVNIQSGEENLTSSMSRIMDTDMAVEMALYTQQNVLSQAATAMLAQANQRPQEVLQLLAR